MRQCIVRRIPKTLLEIKHNSNTFKHIRQIVISLPKHNLKKIYDCIIKFSKKKLFVKNRKNMWDHNKTFLEQIKNSWEIKNCFKNIKVFMSL